MTVDEATDVLTAEHGNIRVREAARVLLGHHSKLVFGLEAIVASMAQQREWKGAFLERTAILTYLREHANETTAIGGQWIILDVARQIDDLRHHGFGS